MSAEISDDDPRIPARPIWAMVILALPIVGVLLTFLAYGVMWSLGLSGRVARGEPMELRFVGCAEAEPYLRGRLDDMGLEGTWSTTSDGYAVTVVPTGDREVDAALATTLSVPAALQVTSQGETLATNADLREATVRMDIFMVPYVLLRLESAAAERVKHAMRTDPGGKLRFLVDGVDVGWQSNTNPVATGDLEINLTIEDDLERMRAVAAWSVTLDHGPLPCPVHPAN